MNYSSAGFAAVRHGMDNYNLSTSQMDPEGMIRNHLQNLMRVNSMADLLSMPYHENADLKQNMEVLPLELKTLFHKLFNPNKARVVLKELLPFKLRKSPLPSCHQLITPKLNSYRCFDCQIHPESLLCQDCFLRGNHEYHRFVQLKEEGDCDCGSHGLIKESGFCPLHFGAEEIIEIDTSEEFVFNLYVRQLFIWMLKLLKISSKDGEIFLLNFLLYLTEINDQSPYYNKLTTRILFGEKDAMVDHVFYVCLNSEERGKLVVAALNLFFKMLASREFKERLLTALIHNYNRLHNFEFSKFVKLFYPVLSDPPAVISAMNAHPIALRPERPFNVAAFYKDLLVITDMAPAAAQAFLRPLLMADIIIFPFLGRVEARCELANDLIVTVFPEFQKEEQVYYKLLVRIIRVVDEKEVLAVMIRNYCKMILEYSFKKNKIILVPHRVLALLIYKYFDCDLSKVDATAVRDILGLNEELFHQQILKNWLKFAECLFEFAANLTHTNYFENYLSIYAKDKGQLINIDYLGFKVMAALTKQREDTFQEILARIFRVDNEKMNRESSEKAELVKTGNIFLKILMEIVYSPRTEFIINAFLGKENHSFPPFLRRLCNTTGQLTQEQLDRIGRLFNLREMRRETIDSAVNFDQARKRYIPKPDEQPSDINLQFYISLLQTKFSKFIQRKAENERYLQLSESQEALKQQLLSCSMVYSVVRKQLMLIKDNPQNRNLIKDLIRTLKTIKLAYRRQEDQFEKLLATILKEISLKYPPTQSPLCQNQQFLQEIERELADGSRQAQPAEANDKDAQRRKELLRLKKEKMLKNKKFKENQEKFLEPQREQEEEVGEEACLICKENKDSGLLCYVGKMRFSSLLFEFMEAKGDNVIFKSCFHTVHYDCFMRMEKSGEASSCPLCKSAINIVLPLEGDGRYILLEKITNRIEHVLNYFLLRDESKERRGFIVEVVLYLAYLLATNIDDLGRINERQVRLCRVLYVLLEHSIGFHDRRVRAELAYQSFMDKIKPERNLLHYKYLVNLVQSLISWSASNSTDIDQPLECINDLSFHFPTTTIAQLLAFVNSFVSPPSISALEPIIVASEEVSSKVEEESDPITFTRFWSPPLDMAGLFEQRSVNMHLCDLGHQVCKCVICETPCCLSCKQAGDHAAQQHPRECLLFNTLTGGMLYYFRGMEIVIKCLYTNDTGRTWKPELKQEGFLLDGKLYSDILQELTAGSLFNYLITTFEGLKGASIADRI